MAKISKNDENSILEVTKNAAADFYKSECNQLIIHLRVNSQMYAYLLPFQHDINIILLPF